MKRLIAVIGLALAVTMPAHATDSIYGDLFPFENRASSFSVVIDAKSMDRLSVQMSYTLPLVAAVQLSAANVSTSNDTFAVTAHGLSTAQAVHFSSAPTQAPVPLLAGSTYYVIKISDNLLQLATTYAQAVSGDKIDLLTVGLSTVTWTLIPLPFAAGSAGYTWQGSNDGTNFATVTSVGYTLGQASQTITGAGAQNFDWGEYPYRFLKLNYNGPLNGIIKLRAYIHAKLRS